MPAKGPTARGGGPATAPSTECLSKVLLTSSTACPLPWPLLPFPPPVISHSGQLSPAPGSPPALSVSTLTSALPPTQAEEEGKRLTQPRGRFQGCCREAWRRESLKFQRASRGLEDSSQPFMPASHPSAPWGIFAQGTPTTQGRSQEGDWIVPQLSFSLCPVQSWARLQARFLLPQISVIWDQSSSMVGRMLNFHAAPAHYVVPQTQPGVNPEHARSKI